MPFLTIVTGTYRRPIMLRRNMASVQAQSDQDVEQVFLEGDDQSGIDGFHRRLAENQERYRGQYIYILPDDDLLVDLEFVGGLRTIVEEWDPDVIMVKANKLRLGILPDAMTWGQWPVLGHVDILNYVVCAPLWKRFSASFAKRDHPYYDGAYAGDFSFIYDVFSTNPRVLWWDRVVARSQRISHGRPE
jgi:hypothetical protein